MLDLYYRQRNRYLSEKFKRDEFVGESVYREVYRAPYEKSTEESKEKSKKESTEESTLRNFWRILRWVPRILFHDPCKASAYL